jgi:hypothetical protein
MREDQFAVYHKSPFGDAMIFNIYPGARRIPAGFDDTPAAILNRLPPDTRFFLYHIDLTKSHAFPNGRAELTQMLLARGIEVLNSNITDVSKPFLHQACVRAGINCPKAESEGESDELIMVKTAANCGGASERKLPPKRRKQLGVPEPHDEISHTQLYKVLPRRAVPTEWWVDPRLSFDSYIANRANRFWRIYSFLDRIVLTEAAAPGFCKKPDGAEYRHNSFGKFTANGLDVEKKAFEVSPKLVSQVIGIVHELKMSFGTIDLAGDDLGDYYVIDVNTTPTGPTFAQLGLLEHLRTAVGITMKPRRPLSRWLAGS